jgi:hypothetical protein
MKDKKIVLKIDGKEFHVAGEPVQIFPPKFETPPKESEGWLTFRTGRNWRHEVHVLIDAGWCLEPARSLRHIDSSGNYYDMTPFGNFYNGKGNTDFGPATLKVVSLKRAKEVFKTKCANDCGVDYDRDRYEFKCRLNGKRYPGSIWWSRAPDCPLLTYNREELVKRSVQLGWTRAHCIRLAGVDPDAMEEVADAEASTDPI